MATYQHLQEPLIQAFPASTMTLTNDGLSLTIARGVWTPCVWNVLMRLLASWGAQGVSWIARPFWTPAIPGQPRWKRITCDGLTRLLYALLIPPTHRLRTLFEAFDWPWIDGQCAGPYRGS